MCTSRWGISTLFVIDMIYFFPDPRQSVTVESIPTPKIVEDVNRAVDVKPHNPTDTDVLIMNKENEDRPTSFFAQPGILAGIVLISENYYLIMPSPFW